MKRSAWRARTWSQLRSAATTYRSALSIGRTVRASSIVQKHYGNPAGRLRGSLPGIGRRPRPLRPRPPASPARSRSLALSERDRRRRARGGRTRSRAVATVFLTGRECPWRCVMCDLWRYTTPADTPPGAIPAQVTRRAARARARASAPVTQMKLYNAGSFFDPRAVPESDYDADRRRARRARAGRRRVASGAHRPSRRSLSRRARSSPCAVDGSATGPQLEVAMGLETVHPDALERLHKRMTVDQFADAADALAAPRRVAARVPADLAAVRAAGRTGRVAAASRSTSRSTAAPRSCR